jgi:hypothetical protein
VIFDNPINILCFNRPEYLRELLFSMKSQTVHLPADLLHFWVDGFADSKDEMLGNLNNTHEIISTIEGFFPTSHIKTSERNLGIARNYWRAELDSFERLGASSAFFLEEDLVLSPYYFELTMKMDSLFSSNKVVSHFSPTGDITHTSAAPKEFFQAFGHNWGYLLRGWHHSERRNLLEEYIEIISKRPYYLRHQLESQILEHFYNKGIILAGTSQDAIKDGLRNHFERVSVTTLDPWASNIGVLGEHFQSESPHHNRAIAKDLTSFPNNFDPKQNERLALDGKSKTSSQVYQNYLSHFRICSGERDALLGERDALLGERDALLGERDALLGERDALLGERDALLGERDALLGERDALLGERDALLASTIWRSTEWLRKCINQSKKYFFN